MTRSIALPPASLVPPLPSQQGIRPAGKKRNTAEKKGGTSNKNLCLVYRVVGFMSIMELLLNLQYGTNLFTRGSSGIVVRYLSKALLNTSTEHYFMSLVWAGRALKSLGPLIARLEIREPQVLYAGWSRRSNMRHRGTNSKIWNDTLKHLP